MTTISVADLIINDCANEVTDGFVHINHLSRNQLTLVLWVLVLGDVTKCFPFSTIRMNNEVEWYDHTLLVQDMLSLGWGSRVMYSHRRRACVATYNHWAYGEIAIHGDTATDTVSRLWIAQRLQMTKIHISYNDAYGVRLVTWLPTTDGPVFRTFQRNYHRTWVPLT